MPTSSRAGRYGSTLGYPGANFGVAGIYTHIEPPEGQAFPVRFNRIFAYVQL